MSSAREQHPNPSGVSSWMEIVSGRRAGLVASGCRAGLSLLEPFYAAVMALRNRAFDRGWRAQTRIPVPVISVGNLTAGGTGKTPTVAWVVRTLQSLGTQPAIISRGYGGRGGTNDEKLLLDQLLPGVPHRLNPDRVSAARELTRATGPDRPSVLVLDDAFQHRQIARDFDLVLVDCLNPWGFGHQLPRGLLREPLQSLHRASGVLLTRGDQVDEETRHGILETIHRWTSAPVLTSHFTPTRLINARGEVRSLEQLQHQHAAAFCGIGNPIGFRRTLTGCGFAIPEKRFRVYPDHHVYQPADFEAIGAWAKSWGVECLLTTHKDLVKIPMAHLSGVPVWALEIELRFEDHASEIQMAELLRNVVADDDSARGKNRHIP